VPYQGGLGGGRTYLKSWCPVSPFPNGELDDRSSGAGVAPTLGVSDGGSARLRHRSPSSQGSDGATLWTSPSVFAVIVWFDRGSVRRQKP
jgi:hypothetical protein